MTIKQASVLLSRVALFVLYFWFGLLKVINMSPASDMVHKVFDTTLGYVPFLSFGIFFILFGLLEVLIGILFIIPNLERYAINLFFLHIIATILPLFILSEVWTAMFVPTLEGQYIVKNLALIACVFTVWSSIPKKLPVDVII